MKGGRFRERKTILKALALKQKRKKSAEIPINRNLSQTTY